MPLLNNPPKVVKILVVLGVIFVIALFVSTCHGAEFDLGGGATYIRGQAPVAAATVVWPKQIGDIDVYAGAYLIGDYDLDGQHYAGQIIARAGVTPHIGPFGISLGLAYIQHEDAINSGNLNFNLGLSYNIGKNWQLGLGHVSNAGTHMPNLGRDLITVTRRFR